MGINNEAGFRAWLLAQNRWSVKAQNDLVSRLKRADKIAALETTASTSQYLSLLESKPEWAAVPRASRTGMLAAARLYLSWLHQTP